MSRPNPLILLSILAATFLGLAWIGQRPGALLISAHEGDTFHLLDILFRMQAGQAPHQDFMTPIGILAFWPIEFWLSRGFGAGMAILYAQILVAAILGPFIFYVARSRLTPKTGYAFAAFAVALVLGVAFGGSDKGLSVSMHYNRWAWAVAYLVIFLAVLRPRGRAFETLDAALIGIGLSLLALTKITFFVALAPGIAVLLLLRAQMRVTAVIAVTGALCAGIATLMLGFGYWAGYLGDLLTVSSTDVRPHPSASLSEVLASPETIGATFVGLMTFLLVSRAGLRAEALGLLFLIAGCIFITYQNFGNDPKWLVAAAVLLIVLRPQAGAAEVQGVDVRIAMGGIATAAILLFLPSAMTIVLSPIRHGTEDIAEYSPLLPAQPEMHHDIRTRADRGATTTAQVELDVPGSVWFTYRAAADRPAVHTLNAIPFPECQLMAGTLSWFDALSRDLARLDVPEGSQLFVADILAAFWLFGPYEPLEAGAPWYYGNLSGLQNADYIVVPKCGFVPEARNIMITEMTEAGVPLETVAESELLALFRVAQP